MNLNKKQISKIKLSIKENRNKKKLELEKPKVEQFNESFKGIMKMLSYVYGDFSNEQKNQNKKQLLKLPDLSEESSKYNEERIDQFIFVVENKKSKKDIERIVSKFIFSSIHNMPEYYRKKAEKLKRSTEEFIIIIHNDITTREQKNNALKRLHQVIQALQELQAQS